MWNLNLDFIDLDYTINIVSQTNGRENGPSVIIMSPTDTNDTLFFYGLLETKSAYKIWRSFDIMFKLI